MINMFSNSNNDATATNNDIMEDNVNDSNNDNDNDTNKK